MSKPKVFVTRDIPEPGLRMIRNVAEVQVWPQETPPPYEALQASVHGVAGLVCLLTDQVDAGVLDAAGGDLRVVSQMAVGYDNIDLEAATARGIPVGHTPGVLTETTADFAFALLMAAARRLVEGAQYVKAGRWVTWGPTLLMGADVHRATLGIIGLGRIGRALARRAQGFEMRVMYYDPSVEAITVQDLDVEPCPLDELLAEADFLSLHVPLSEDTFHLIGARQLKRMKPSAVLINTARGPVVDHKALYLALKRGEIAYAALDVTNPEPLPPNDPLLTLDNCLVMPHIASSSLQTRGKMASMAAANLAAGLAGERLPHCANPQVYDR